jgi:hypothetical protein
MVNNSPVKLDCPCTEECERHGKCKTCRDYHQTKGDRSYCKRINSTTGENSLTEHQHPHDHHHNHMHKH